VALNRCEECFLIIPTALDLCQPCSLSYSGRRGSSDDDDDDEDEFAASRYKPFLSKILKQLVGADEQPLSFEDFPSVMPMPESSASSGTAASARRKKKHHGAVEGSARKGAGASKRWASTAASSKGKASATSFTGGRNIVFTVGGMAYPEMNVCRDIMAQESREIVFGSTAFVTAREFVDDLSTLS
jgi:syntaxin-binding protein 1